MALIPCPNCQCEVEDSASHCLYCGESVVPGAYGSVAPSVAKKRESSVSKIVVGIILAIIILIAIFSNIGADTNPSSGASSLERKTIAQSHAEVFVKKYLVSPSTADFPPYSEYSYDFDGDIWTVGGYVDAQNAFGATLREYWTVKFSVSGSEFENAKLDNIDFK